MPGSATGRVGTAAQPWVAGLPGRNPARVVELEIAAHALATDADGLVESEQPAVEPAPTWNEPTEAVDLAVVRGVDPGSRRGLGEGGPDGRARPRRGRQQGGDGEPGLAGRYPIVRTLAESRQTRKHGRARVGKRTDERPTPRGAGRRVAFGRSSEAQQPPRMQSLVLMLAETISVEASTEPVTRTPGGGAPPGPSRVVRSKRASSRKMWV